MSERSGTFTGLDHSSSPREFYGFAPHRRLRRGRIAPGAFLKALARVEEMIEVGDAATPAVKDREFSTGDDPPDAPDGGFLQLTVTLSAGSGRHRAIGH